MILVEKEERFKKIFNFILKRQKLIIKQTEFCFNKNKKIFYFFYKPKWIRTQYVHERLNNLFNVIFSKKKFHKTIFSDYLRILVFLIKPYFLNIATFY